ncbi:MAG: VCBS repeat-containing protein [Planctomycetes bacterium]|nr:VCBS repeat-containing protein [Planctomycetota bacterium]MCH9724687.1 VCBS repeat-containing protein [Planctomycetota bacterium]MCH9774838.1 VCBS repeat-containing protein [Planctomycetota bacterium]
MKVILYHFVVCCLLFLIDNTVFAEAIEFQKMVLTNKYYADGITTGDFNKDGNVDIVAGPYWYEGPVFKTRHSYYEPVALPPEKSPSNCMLLFTYDFNGDGWDDILVLGRVHLHKAFWYENPQTSNGVWKRHFVFDRVQGESPLLVDLTRDGKPELICHWGSHWGWLQPDWNAPEKPWTFQALSPKRNWGKFYHGMGAGDINGDGSPDIVINDGWFENPSQQTGEWYFHPFKFSKERGGAQIFVYDVDGDGDNDVISSLDAHGWGVAWFEHIKTGEMISFKQHKIMGDRSESVQYGVAFTQPHALSLVDMNGDGLKDVVTGKRRWAHGPKGDIEPNEIPVIYWFQLNRSADGTVKYTPHLVDDWSGVGVQIDALDVNQDGKADILSASKLGTFLFLNSSK